MNVLRWSLLFLMVLGLGACAFDKNSNTDNQREIKDNAELAEKFSRITGLYRGTIQTSAGTQQVELSFYPFYKRNGENSNGEDRYKPELRAHYRRLDKVTEDVILAVRYYEETSQLLMSNAESTSGTVLNVDARQSGEMIAGNVSRNNLPLGWLEVRLVTRDYRVPNPNEQEEKNQRRRELYKTITGVYSGVVKPSAREGAPFAISVRLYHVDEIISGVATTVLKAYYTPADDPGRTLALNMHADYQNDGETPTISLASSGAVGNNDKDYWVTINGTLTPGLIRGTFNNHRALIGEVTLKKQ